MCGSQLLISLELSTARIRSAKLRQVKWWALQSRFGILRVVLRCVDCQSFRIFGLLDSKYGGIIILLDVGKYQSGLRNIL